MVGLLQHSTYLAGSAEGLLAALAGPADRWLDATPLDGDRFLLRLVPDGLLEDPEATIVLVIGVGPVARTPDHVLRRMSFVVPDLTPEVRCDLELSLARAHGARLRLRGEYRPPLATGDVRAVAEVVEAVTRPLVDGIAERLCIPPGAHPQTHDRNVNRPLPQAGPSH